ncbi:MAG: HAMP domain-containing histidine kinase [Pseudobdellovibrionaceae bacterium]|nr:MAG: HAMP domain-containing histidine kinase [Pseudobdellovibrionaceae bacterium]
MNSQAADKNLLTRLLLIQLGFISFILGLFLFSTAINKQEMAKQITYQVQSQLKSAPSREVPEALAAAQIENFNATGYFDENGHRVFTLPASLNPSYFSKRGIWETLTNGLIEIKVYFDDEQKNVAGTLKFVYPRFSFVPYALIFWILCVFGSVILFRHYRKVWLSSLETEDAKKQNALVSQIIGQVNHDLKSPIQTLFAVVDDSENLSERDKNSIYSAIERIQGITGDLKSLVKSGKSTNDSLVPAKSDQKILHFASSLKQLCEEKKIAYKDHQFSLEFEVDTEALSKAAYISESDFLRVCSNLLRNSVEAIESKFSEQVGGKISVKMQKHDNCIQISFYDNGVGIPKDHYGKIKQEGFTFGKPNGTGLGLHYVFQKMEQWNGNIALESQLNDWTRFDLFIPFEPEIDIYKSELNLDCYETILVLDDDKSVFERWSRKLKNFKGQIAYINSPGQIKEYAENIRSKKCLALIDQEIRGSSYSGLSIIIDYGLSKEAVLVTNNYANSDIYQKVKELGGWIVPKPIIEEMLIQQR